MLEKSCTKLYEVNFNQIQEFKKYMIERKNRTEETVKAYIRDLEQFQTFVYDTGGKMNDLTETDVNTYIKHLDKERQLKAVTIERKANAIKQFCYFTDQAKAVIDIGFFLPKKQATDGIAPNTLKRNEVLAIQRIVDGFKARDRAIIYTMLYTGLRVSEVMNLDKADLEFKNGGILTVNRGKGNKEREVPFPANLRNIIKRYLELREDELEPLFISNYKKRMSKRSIQNVVDKVHDLFNAGKKEEDQLNIHSHLFRHNFAKFLVIEKGYVPASAQQVMGHSSVKTTERYLKRSMREIAEDLDDIAF